jgi:hypothetical protein
MLVAGATGAQAITNFQQDVNAAIDAGLGYAVTNNWYTNGNNATGLLLLALLEKRPDIGGYNGLDASEQAQADAAAKTLIDGANFAARGGQYAYTDGQALMALSVFSDTGGPDNPNGSVNNVRWAIDRVVDRLVANQNPASSACSGFWEYTGPGCDSSTTQYAVAGLAAAKSYYLNQGDPGSRLPAIQAALDLTAAGYASRAKNAPADPIFGDCGSQGCKGHAYQVSTNYTSYQQTASGTWGQLLGAGNNLNSNGVQSYLRWLYNAYNYANIPVYYESWPPFYMYYMWSSSKAYAILEGSGVSPAAGNIGTANLGTLAAYNSVTGAQRLAHRDPLTDVRPPVRGADASGPCPAPGDGYYCETPQSWYYDYAYTLLSRQQASGFFPNPNGSWGAAGATEADHAYALLVLVRSIGGACVDTDGDGVCDVDDNCVTTPNPNQEDTDYLSCPVGTSAPCPDGVGDACDNCPDNYNPTQDPSVCQIARCDVDGDGDIDKSDLSLISRARGKTVPPLDPAYDANGDGLVTPADVKVCIPQCTRPGCAIQ